MLSPAIKTVIKMMIYLPENKQVELVEYLKNYLHNSQEENSQEELEWQASFNKSQKKLVAAAQLAKQQIYEGKARPLN